MAIEVFPVVHINDIREAADQASVAFEAGADGVYLIDHRAGVPTRLINTFNDVAKEHPDKFVGVNYLQYDSAATAFDDVLLRESANELVRLPDGIWVDNADQSKETTMKIRADFPHLNAIRYLGGVAFKYTDFYKEDPEEAAHEATRLMDYVDVVTTSGRGTGYAPSPEKIARMKEAIGPDKKLAVASGISSENIAQYGQTFDQLLVSTSIETEPYSGIFIPSRVAELIKRAREQSVQV